MVTLDIGNQKTAVRMQGTSDQAGIFIARLSAKGL
jgi:hypothetical protein